MARDPRDVDSSQVMEGRVVRFSQARTQGSALTFIDSALPGHRRLNVALIGDTAAEDPGLRPLIGGPHTFQLGMFMCLSGEGPAWHLHDYVEAFIPLSGSWLFRVATSEQRLDDPDGEFKLSPWDVISVPAGSWRSFENTSPEPAWCLGVLDAHEQFAFKDPQWPAPIVDAAARMGLHADESGRLMDSPESSRLRVELGRNLAAAASRTVPPSPDGDARASQETVS